MRAKVPAYFALRLSTDDVDRLRLVAAFEKRKPSAIAREAIRHGIAEHLLRIASGTPATEPVR